MNKRLVIHPPRDFLHAGKLLPRHDGDDPRAPEFQHAGVDIDLRECRFVRPAATVWCVVYLMLVRHLGIPCRLRIPTHAGVSMHLKSVGAFERLREAGVEVEDRGVSTHVDPKTILPLTQLRTLGDAQRITNDAFDRLSAANLASVNLTRMVSELFSELANNATEHSESPVGAFAWIQSVKFKLGPRLVCVVADGGIGIKQGLWKNAALRKRASYDWDALDLATRERVSGTQNPHRGIGLFAVAEDARQLGGRLLLHSGLGSLEISEDRQSTAKRTRLFPGTLAYLAIPS